MQINKKVMKYAILIHNFFSMKELVIRLAHIVSRDTNQLYQFCGKCWEYSNKNTVLQSKSLLWKEQNSEIVNNSTAAGYKHAWLAVCENNTAYRSSSWIFINHCSTINMNNISITICSKTIVYKHIHKVKLYTELPPIH